MGKEWDIMGRDANHIDLGLNGFRISMSIGLMNPYGFLDYHSLKPWC